MRSSSMMAATAAVLLAAGSAMAQTDKDSVLTYPAAFFADMRPNTALDMIGRLPGFSFTNTGSARGFAGNAGNVLIDGQRPTSKSDDLQSILNRIQASDVERIDVIRGGAPGIDMQGQTIIANIIRKKESSTQWLLEASENIFQDGHTIPGLNLNFTRHDGPKTFEFSATRYNSFDDSVGNGFHTYRDGNGNLTEYQRAQTTGHGSGGAFTGAATLPLWGGTFKANLALQDSPFMSSAEYFGADDHRYISDINVGRNAELGLHWNGDFGKLQDETLFLQRIGFSKDVNASFRTINNNPDDEVFRSSSTTDETILRETLRYPLNDALTLEGGAEGAYNSLDGDTAFAINAIDFPLPDAHAHVDEKRGEIFGQGTWKISSQWLLEAGARFEYSRIAERSDTTKQKRTFFYPKPRAVLTWSPTALDQVRVRYEKVVGQLDFGNFIAAGNLGGNGVTSGNSDIRPDQRTQYEISYEHHFWEKGDVTLQLIHEDITDVVDLVRVNDPNGGDPFNAPGNIGNGVNNQINLTLTVPFDRLWVPNGLLKISSDLQYSSVRDPVTGLHRVITAERPQNITVKFTQDIQSLKSTWYVFYYNCWDEKYFRLEQTQHRRTIAPYLEAGWTYKPTPDWSFEVDVVNFGRFVYDNQYFNFDGPRDTGHLIQIEERSMKSQPRIFIDIRKTF